MNYDYPEGSRWTLDLLTDAASARVDGPAMSRTSIHRTLTEVDLRPHKIRIWVHSRDPLFKEKVNDVVGLYLEPPGDAVVLSVDEKTSIQALERPHYQGKPAKPGQPGRQEFEYVRHGTTSLIAAFNVQSGKVVHRLGPTRTADDLLAFMEQVAEDYRDAKKVVVIWDNLNIHLEGSTRRWSAFNARHGNRFESAGKRKSGKTRKGDGWLREALVEAAWGAARTRGTYLKAQYHHLVGRRGKKRAIVAVAHSIIIAIWHMLSDDEPYKDLGYGYFYQRNKDALARRMGRRLEDLGYKITIEAVS